MSKFLIDFENVRSEGLRGVENLTEEDQVWIFYSKNADSITFEVYDLIGKSKAKIHKYKIARGGKNSLDFQLSSFVGYMLNEDWTESYYIVSKDNGYRYVLDFWRLTYERQGVRLYEVASIQDALRPANSRKEKQLMEPIYDESDLDEEVISESNEILSGNLVSYAEPEEVPVVSEVASAVEEKENGNKSRKNGRNRKHGRNHSDEKQANESAKVTTETESTESAQEEVIVEIRAVPQTAASADDSKAVAEKSVEETVKEAVEVTEEKPAEKKSRKNSKDKSRKDKKKSTAEAVVETAETAESTETAEASVEAVADSESESAASDITEATIIGGADAPTAIVIPAKKSGRGRKSKASKAAENATATEEAAAEAPKATEAEATSDAEKAEVSAEEAQSSDKPADRKKKKSGKKDKKAAESKEKDADQKAVDQKESDKTEPSKESEAGNKDSKNGNKDSKSGSKDSKPATSAKKGNGNQEPVVPRLAKGEVRSKLNGLLTKATLPEGVDLSTCVKKSAEFVIESDGKKAFYDRVIGLWGQKVGMEIYKVLKSEYPGLRKIIVQATEEKKN
ncbi:MAG: hypothetical protein J5825_09275 [Lachnospiraceae bacterium]|nr:hypothetical protein [Lachnospiraceae bacterium]